MKEMQKKLQIETSIRFSSTKQEKMKYETEAESKKMYTDIIATEFKQLKVRYA